jgi:hypothetical protein
MKLLSVFAIGAISAFSMGANLYVQGLVAGKNESVKIKYGSSNLNVKAGTFKGKLNGGASFDMYCVDLDHTVSPPSTYQVDVLSLAPLSNGLLAGRLYEKYAHTVNTARKGAALQLAIWDAVVDGGNGFTTGNLKNNGTSSATINQAKAYLTGALASNLTPTTNYLRAKDHPHGRNQNMIGGCEPVPEPASMAAILIGAAGVIRRRRKS